jgi:hypothetical protein
MSWTVHFRAVVNKSNHEWLAFHKNGSVSNTLGRSVKKTTRPRLLAVAWCSQDPTGTDMPHELRFECEQSKERDTSHSLCVGYKTKLYLNRLNQGRQKGSFTRDIKLTDVLCGDEAIQAASQLLLPLGAFGHTLFVFVASASWVATHGRKGSHALDIPLLLRFPQRDIRITVNVTLFPHGRLWSRFELVRPLATIDRILQQDTPYFGYVVPPPPLPEEENVDERAACDTPPAPVEETQSTPPAPEYALCEPWMEIGDIPLPPMGADDVMDIERYLV